MTTNEELAVVNPDEYRGVFKQAIREHSALPLSQIAKRAGMSSSQMTFYTTGKLFPSPETASRIASALEITFREFRRKIVMRNQHGFHSHLYVFGEKCRTQKRKRLDEHKRKTIAMQKEGFGIEHMPEYRSAACNNVHAVSEVEKEAGFTPHKDITPEDWAYFVGRAPNLLAEFTTKNTSHREREKALSNLEAWAELDDSPEILEAHEKEQAENAANELPILYWYAPVWRTVLVIETLPNTT